MTVYAIAQLTVHDRETYDRYTPGFMPILHQYDGVLLAADERPRVVEGASDSQKIVVASFADESGFDRWYNSPEYQAILGDRLASTHGPLLLVRGVRRP